jgi:transposase
MIGIGPATRIHLLAGATDMRRGFDGLFALAAGLLKADPLSGHVFGFCNKSRTRLKLLYWDGSGLWVAAKRLEKGRFAWPEAGGAADRCVVLTQAQLTLLLNGIDLSATRARRWHRVETSLRQAG